LIQFWPIIVEAVLQRIDRTWSGRLEPLYKLSTLLLLFSC